MKTIMNKLRFALLLGFLTIGITVLAQEIANIEKMSISTQMFLDEMAGKISFDVPKQDLRGGDKLKPNRIPQRPIATPDTIDGEVYISAFVRVTNENDIIELENLGVLIQCRFDEGLLTANIPINMIEKVAALEGVINIEVGETMEVETDLARQATNVDDVLTLSQDATIAGLQHIYDGSGVILGIIDSGIDFDHIAFKDKNGNNRIKRAYAYNGSTETDWTGSGSMPNDGVTTSDHGTHTSSIAGGSSVIINGTDVTVTDDHANATYGGMAPGADLFLAGVNGLISTYTSNAFQKMCDYADAVGKPLVVSNSWSNGYGPRDGQYGGGAEVVVKQLFGDSHPNRICLFASANRAGNAVASEGGGLYASGTASSSNPLGAIVRCNYYSDRDCGYYYYGNVVDAWARTPNVSLACKIYVLNTSTGAIITTVTLTPPSSGNSTTVSGLSSYYNGTFTAYWATNSNTGKRQFRLYANGCKSQSVSGSSSYYTSNYTLAVEVYPTSGSSYVDMWGGAYCYYTNYLTTSGHNWVLGSDDVSVSDHAVMPEVISVGSYKTRDGYSSASIGDISPFSGYATASACPAGTMHPWITAPGEVIISAYNHNRTGRSSDPLVNNANYPYGTAQGTSMATPAAAGIVALWLQAATECGKTLTNSEVKDIMAQTAIKDSWVTSGANATHFGNGKINALAGIEYILAEHGGPHIIASPTNVTFEGEPGNSYTQTVNVSGLMLTDDIIATLNDQYGVYSISTTNLGSGGNLVITYNPTYTGYHTATITLTSTDADPVTISGTAQIKADVTVCDESGVNQYLPVYGYYYEQAQVNQMLYPAAKFNNSGMNGKTIKKITFYPTTSGSYSGINFYYQASRGNGTVTVKLANMPSGTSGYSSTATRKNATFTTVKTITMPSSAQTGLTEWVFDNLSDDFVYEGGDLLIEVVTEAGQYGRTYFAGETQSTYTGMYSYGSTSRGQQFLPKVTFEWEAEVIPITAGTVSPSSVTFTDAIIGRTSSQTVTITNTGNQDFTPSLDLTNLPDVFNVTGNDLVQPNNSINLTVTYTPTDEGPHSGSFTITIGDVTYTVTVTGNGITVNSTLTSNAVMVPVYKTDLDVYGPYTVQQMLDDTNHQLEENITNGHVQVLAKNDQAITGYRLFHNPATKSSENNWAAGNDQSSIAYATHDIAYDNFTTYVHNENWVQYEVIDFNGASEKWIEMVDNETVDDFKDTWYVPVTVANGRITQGNTYGSRMEQNPTISGMGCEVIYDHSSRCRDPYYDGTTGMYYAYMTAGVRVNGDIPDIDINGHTYECFLVRAWRQYKPYVIGQGVGEMTEELIDEVNVSGTGSQSGFAGAGSWTEQDANGSYLHNAYTFCIENGKHKDVKFYGRMYYRRVDDQTAGLRGNRDGGSGFAMGGSADPGDPTDVTSFFIDKDVVDVTYINPLGMTSKKPFDGINIIVTRFSDGTTSTAKVIK